MNTSNSTVSTVVTNPNVNVTEVRIIRVTNGTEPTLMIAEREVGRQRPIPAKGRVRRPRFKHWAKQ